MFNELLFCAHVVVVSASVLLGLAHSYGVLLAVLSMQLILANVFVTKQIMLFGMATTCSEVFIVSGMYGVSLVQAYFGANRARQTIFYTFSFLALFVLFAQLHIWYLPLAHSPVGPALVALLSTAPRMMAASMVSYVISERVHVWFSRRMNAQGAWSLARIAAICLGQTVDTLTFAFVGLYGLVDHLASIIVVSLIVKAIVIVALSPLLSLAQWLIPLHRGPHE